MLRTANFSVGLAMPAIKISNLVNVVIRSALQYLQEKLQIGNPEVTVVKSNSIDLSAPEHGIGRTAYKIAEVTQTAINDLRA